MESPAVPRPDGELQNRYTRWKSLVPVLYDWFTNHNLVWPSLSCRWGPILEQGSSRIRQQLYITEQTYGDYPNAIVVTNCELLKPRVAAPEPLSQFNEEHKSPYIKRFKTIVHPGEVNRIRELPQDSKIVATHTDKPEVYVWNLQTQPNRSTAPGTSPSKPDLVLTGHTLNAEFALALSRSSPLVLSGGKDKLVVLWDIKEPLAELKPGGRQTWNSGGTGVSDTTTVAALGTFKGHTQTVEDVQFRPSSSYEFCSVGDDCSLLLWDSRSGTRPTLKVANAHHDDVHCVDWNAHEENHILTGSADNSVRLFDLRKLTATGHGLPVEKFEGHTSAVTCVQWCPDKASVFGSSAEDGLLNVWDYEKAGKGSKPMKTGFPKRPMGLFFQHTGHRDKVVDFHWDPIEPWMLVSVSEDSKGGGTLQIWRINDLIYRPEEEVLSELETFRQAIMADHS